MQLDQFTYNDLSIFQAEEEYSVFHRLDFTRTIGGRAWLMKYFREPFSDLGKIHNTQQSIRIILEKLDQWPLSISNGTILVLEKFLDYNLDPLPRAADNMNSYLYRLLHSPDFSMARFSLEHFSDFVRAMKELQELMDVDGVPPRMQMLLLRCRKLLQHQQVDELYKRPPGKSFSIRETVYFGQFFHHSFRSHANELIDIYSQFDAWYSMAMAMKKFHLQFPTFLEQESPCFEAKGLFHLLLSHPVPYDISMNPESNFIFLTGANMAGKSTFIKSTGLAVFLAHIGMGVPAQSMKLTLFDGILSNINVADNIAKGESYFFNEVHRIKNTVIRINDGRKWLVLIDELFKGTNIQDAMKCSSTVIKGLLRMRNGLFILSTHLYEIGEELRQYPNISFKYFETKTEGDKLHFSYQLKDGISTDRLGYLILRREGVVDLLESIP
jgi:DNA mismatch repair protein MutS